MPFQNHCKSTESLPEAIAAEQQVFKHLTPVSQMTPQLKHASTLTPDTATQLVQFL